MPPEATTPPILVVEDDPSVRGLLRTLVEVEGYPAIAAPDGVSGLVRASAAKPSLVLLDVKMPDLGGLRVLEELRDNPRLANVPVLVVTGDSDAIPRLRERLGERSVFGKPFDAHELLARARELAGPPEQDPGDPTDTAKEP